MAAIRILKLMRREIGLLTSDWRLTVIVLVMPFVYTLMIGYLYLPKRVTDIPTFVLDQDRSPMSRAVIQAAERNDSFKITRYVESEEEFMEAVRAGEAFALLWFPPRFQESARGGAPARMVALIDGSNLLLSNTLYKGVTTIGTTFSLGIQIKKMNARGAPMDHAREGVTPVDAGARVLFNPGFSYSDFVLPGLAGAVVQQICLLGVALAFARERAHNLLPQALAITHSPLEFLAAKGLFYTGLNLATALGSFALLFRMFGVPVQGSIWAFGALLSMFIIAIVALGILASAALRDELFATEALMLVSLPSFLLSGFTWPQFAMVKGILILSQILPLTHFLMPLRSVLTQGAGLGAIRGELYWLWGLASGSYVLAYFVIRHYMQRAWSVVLAERRQDDSGSAGAAVSLPAGAPAK